MSSDRRVRSVHHSRRPVPGIEALEPRRLLAVDVVEDIFPGAGDSLPDDLVDVRGTLFFVATHPKFGRELWKSGGRASNTDIVVDLRPGTDSSEPANLTAVGRTLFFTAGTRKGGDELWRTDGTAAGTRIVKDINPGKASSDVANLTDVNGTLYFSATDGVHGDELWTSDGTAAGTRMVRDIDAWIDYAGLAASSRPDGFVAFNGAVFFRAVSHQYDYNYTSQLWRTDGTEAGTYEVWDGDVNPAPLTAAGHNLFFVGSLNRSAQILWATGGTYRRTHYVQQVDRWNVEMYAQGDTLVYTGADALWRSDGTTDGTAELKHLDPNRAQSLPSALTAFGGRVYFGVDYGQVDTSAIWRTDGTAKGTQSVYPFYFPERPERDQFAVIGTTLFVSSGSRGLVQSDGTTRGTAQVKRLGYGSNVLSIVASGNALFMAANSAKFGRELWVLPVPAAKSSRTAAAATATAVSRAAGGASPATTGAGTARAVRVSASAVFAAPPRPSDDGEGLLDFQDHRPAGVGA